MDDEVIVETAAEEWGRPLRLIRRLTGGMNGVTLELADAGSRRVLKWVPASERTVFQHGARASHQVAASGVQTAPPIPTSTGALTASALGGELLLMDAISGRELTRGNHDQEQMALVLTRFHAATETQPGEDFFYAGWLREALGEPLPAWVVRVVDDALSEYDALPPVRWCTINGDPSPDEFRQTGESTALLDWGSATTGPALYDVATLYMYLGGPESGGSFIDAYRSADPRSDRDLGSLPAFMRLRGAIQAVYFARRVASNDLTGAQPGDNERGLNDARHLIATWVAR